MSNEFATEQLKTDFGELLTDAEALVKATADMSGERLSEVRTKAKESLRLVKARMADTHQALMANGRAVANNADAYVRESPWEAIAVAAGVGVLVGVLLARR